MAIKYTHGLHQYSDMLWSNDAWLILKGLMCVRKYYATTTSLDCLYKIDWVHWFMLLWIIHADPTSCMLLHLSGIYIGIYTDRHLCDLSVSSDTSLSFVALMFQVIQVLASCFACLSLALSYSCLGFSF